MVRPGLHSIRRLTVSDAYEHAEFKAQLLKYYRPITDEGSD